MRSARFAHALGLGGLLAAAGLFTATLAAAQEAPPAADTAADGTVVGEVAQCVNGVEQPLSNAQVGIEGQTLIAHTDPNGQFSLILPAGDYNLVAMQGDSVLGSRQHVPVLQDQTLDVGILDLSGGACPAQTSATGPATTAPEPNIAPELPATGDTQAPDNVENNGAGYDHGDDSTQGS